jgi:hypothetical protein
LWDTSVTKIRVGAADVPVSVPGSPVASAADVLASPEEDASAVAPPLDAGPVAVEPVGSALVVVGAAAASSVAESPQLARPKIEIRASSLW